MAFVINTRKMRYTGDALASFRESKNIVEVQAVDVATDSESDGSSDSSGHDPLAIVAGSSTERVWVHKEQQTREPQPVKGRHAGFYALTSSIAPWVVEALARYKPSEEVLALTKPFAADFHKVFEEERASSQGLHDIDAMELMYQCTLELDAAFMLAADKTDDPVDFSASAHLHASRAGGDDHFIIWGKLLTGLDCDPPIVVILPFYLMLCQSFSFEPVCHREDFVYAALTGVDWARGSNKFNDRLLAFEDLALRSVPTLDDTKSGGDRCFWRIGFAYLAAINKCENSRPFKAPRYFAVQHGLDPDLAIASRALDTSGVAYMGRDGAGWFDDQGMDSLIGCALPNDVMDLHADVCTGETRNLFRLLYPAGVSMAQAMQTCSTVLSSMLCEVFRGHYRARMNNREDGRISSTSPAYSLCRARHRRIFETLELYIAKYPQFWDWTWEIYQMAKAQITDAAMAESLLCGLKRAARGGKLPDSPRNKFFEKWYDMIEDGSAQLGHKQPLGVGGELAPVVRGIHSLWHQDLRGAGATAPGWGREFDRKSDMFLHEAGELLASKKGSTSADDMYGVSDDMYKFGVAYGRLSMGLPYVAYHTVDAIIMAFGAASL